MTRVQSWDEARLLHLYRALGEEWKAAAIGMIQALKDQQEKLEQKEKDAASSKKSRS